MVRLPVDAVHEKSPSLPKKVVVVTDVEEVQLASSEPSAQSGTPPSHTSFVCRHPNPSVHLNGLTGSVHENKVVVANPSKVEVVVAAVVVVAEAVVVVVVEEVQSASSEPSAHPATRAHAPRPATAAMASSAAIWTNAR